MDPDIPVPSIEGIQHSRASATTDLDMSPDAGNTPFHSMPPEKTPFKTPTSQPASPAPLKIPKSRSGSRGTTPVRERQSTPVLQSKRSHPNLGASRNTTPVRQPFRRASSNLNPISPAVNGITNPLADHLQPIQLTPSLVAKDYFRRELAFHDTIQSKVAVFVHDSCFGHRFSRPRTSKAALSTIVERPERLLATLLGASTAYVRLGKRHAAGSCGPHPDRDPCTGPKPPFVMRKTKRFVELNHPAVTAVHGTKWMEELQIMCDSAEAKLAMNGKELTRPIGYGKDETGNPLPRLHEGDLYLCSESLAALQACLGGVCDAIDAVFSSDATSRAFVNIRPPGHHCAADFPSGFCWLNNVHVGISYAAMNHNLTHAAIIDFDLHHGDGSQTITWDHNRKAQTLPKNAAAHRKVPIGYYSLHDINSYPCEWGDEDKVRNASLCLQNAHGQSIWNVHLEPWSSLTEFWQLYESKYKILLQKTRDFLRQHSDSLRKTGARPKAAIFLSAGFDACQWEGAGMQRHNVNVPTDFYARFTQDIVKLSEEDDLGVDGRVISVLEGGYSDRALASGVLSHLCGLAPDAKVGKTENGVQAVANTSDDISISNEQGYSALWWSESHLEELEAMVAGRAPPPVKKSLKQNGNYSSPTQASTLKMTENARERHSISSQLEARLSLASMVPDPPPEVDWVTASYELSRNLIPDDRSTLSCRHDELNAEATKARRERQSLLTLPTQPEEKMQLRGRRGKAVNTSEVGRPGSRSTNRRTTIAVLNELPDPAKAEPVEGERSRRRSSAASSILSTFTDMKLSDKTEIPINTHVENLPSLTTKWTKQASDPSSGQHAPTRRLTRSRSRERTVEQSAMLLKESLDKDGAITTKFNSDGTNTRSSSLSRPSSMNSSNVTKDGIDELTNGMKKVSIKLKMPTPEQHEANQKKNEQSNVPTAKQARKTPVPRASKPKAAAAPKATRAPAKSRKTGHPTALPVPTAVVPSPLEDRVATTVAQPIITTARANQGTNTTDASGAAPPQSSLPLPMRKQPEAQPIHQKIQGTASTTNIEISQDPALSDLPPRPSAPTPATVTQSEITTSPRKTKEDLPVFTSSTPIPFSGQARMEPVKGKEEQQEEDKKGNPSIWDIPDTPRHLS